MRRTGGAARPHPGPAVSVRSVRSGQRCMRRTGCLRGLPRSACERGLRVTADFIAAVGDHSSDMRLGALYVCHLARISQALEPAQRGHHIAIPS